MKYIRSIMLCSSLVLNPSIAFAASVDGVNQHVSTVLPKTAQLQSAIDTLDAQKSALDQEFLALTYELQAIETYNGALSGKINQLIQSDQDISLQLSSVAEIDREISPLISQMYQSLKAFVAADIPFLKTYREQQISRLGEVIADPNLSVNVKYKTLLEAFIEEQQYAEQMHSYAGRVDIEGVDTQVNFLRLGRVVWYYQRLDGSSSSRWDKENGNWVTLNSENNRQLAMAINIATQVSVPELVNFDLGGLAQ